MEQLDLIPQQEFDPKPELIDLSILPQDCDLSGDKPDKDFVGTVKDFGVLQPIIVMEHDNGSYEVMAGRGRVMAARQAKRGYVWGMVYPAGRISQEAVTLVENSHRRSNMVADAKAIESLMNQGLTARDIANFLRIPKQTVEQRCRLFRNLSPNLRAALLNKSIPISVALLASKLPIETQDLLYEQLQEKGKLTKVDIESARRVVKNDALEEMPHYMFEVNHDWRFEASNNLLLANELIPDSCSEIKEGIKSLLRVISTMPQG